MLDFAYSGEWIPLDLVSCFLELDLDIQLELIMNQ